MRKTSCEVRQESDEMVCRCGKRWDVNDPEPPVCDKNKTGRTLSSVGEPVAVSRLELELETVRPALREIIGDVTGFDVTSVEYRRLAEVAERAYMRGKADA